MVAGRAAERESVVHCAGDDLVCKLLRAADREQGDIERISRYAHVHDVEERELPLAGAASARDEIVAVHALDPGFVRHSRRKPHQLIEPVARFQVGHGADQPFTALGMVCARIVIEKALVVQKARGHNGLILLLPAAAMASHVSLTS